MHTARDTVINAFTKGDIRSVHSKEDVYQDKEPEFVTSMTEITKMRRQKSDELNKMITENDRS